MRGLPASSKIHWLCLQAGLWEQRTAAGQGLENWELYPSAEAAESKLGLGGQGPQPVSGETGDEGLRAARHCRWQGGRTAVGAFQE